MLFEQSGWNSRVTACLKCGNVTLVEAMVIEPQPHDVQCIGNLVTDAAPALLAWLDAWPRYAQGVHDTERYVLLPPGLRAANAADLATLEAAFLEEQHPLDRAARFARVGYPAVGPPEALPWPLTPFEDVRQGLALSAETPLEQLMLVVGTKSWARWVAMPLLRARAGFPALVEEWLGAIDSERRGAALELVRDERMASPGVVAAVGRLIATASISDNSLYTLMNVVDTFGPAARTLVPEMRAVAARIGDSDYYLRKRVEDSVRRVEGAGR